MREDATERFVGGATVSALGSVLAAVTLLDVYEDAVLQSDPLYLTLLENSLPLVFDSVLMVAGWMLVTGRIPYDISPRRVTGWSLVGGFSVFAITGWIYYFQILQSVLKPHVIFTQVVAMGAIAGLLVGVYDGRRTEREAELRIERDRTSTLFENSSDCIAEIEFVENQPVVRRINDAFRQTFEVSDDDIVGKGLDDVIVPPKRDNSAQRINQKAETGSHVEDEVFRQTASGEIRVFRLQVIPLETAGPDTDSYAVYTDITDQHRYESGMASLHDATRELIDSESIEEITDRAVTAAADALDLRIAGIFLYDPSTDSLEPAAQTTAATELIGEPDAFQRDEAISWSVFETDEPEYVRDVHARSGAYNRESPLRSEMILPLGKWGVLIVGSKSVDAFDDLDLSLSRTLAANVEAAMNRAERQQELKQQNERLDTFASVVSHDLRNPLGVARGFLELAQEGDRDAIDRVEDALDRMDHLIETLLTLARSGEAVGELKAISLE
ncbi:MAG: histidine kinase dimerization/phospho-acceptor domain-containing protein, partial [Natronomonas sp.]